MFFLIFYSDSYYLFSHYCYRIPYFLFFRSRLLIVLFSIFYRIFDEAGKTHDR